MQNGKILQMKTVQAIEYVIFSQKAAAYEGRTSITCPFEKLLGLKT